ncbi:MAG: hypothetical protein KGN84_06775 [Acidobacteriota bacterium]|nr:hypothetical protein [Acidobacteriota bacterium]
MTRGPSRLAESLIALLIPPACREEILGDLYECYRSPARYFLSAIRILPFVIASRIRRTAGIQAVLMEAVSLYAGFLGAALMAKAPADAGLLAIPAAVAILVIRVEDAYARPGGRSAYALSRGPAMGLALSLWVTWAWLPHKVALLGFALGLIVSSGVRVLFAPAPGQLRGIRVPFAWLKSEPGEPFTGKRLTGLVLCVVVVVFFALLTRR